ncbi:MAG: TspO/MBR family protein [Pseudomonadota bacterium]
MGGDAILALAVFIVAAVAAAMSGGIFKPGEWYERLNHPSWRPPNWIFPLVWTPLYGMIAWSGFAVWQVAGWSGAAGAFAVYFLHLAVNFGWSWVFFGLRRPDWALAEVALLWLSIVATMVAFSAHSSFAVWLLVPYLAWVSFAAFLNWKMMVLNPKAHELQV